MSSLTRWAVLHSGCGRRSLLFGSSWWVGGVSSSCLCRVTQHQMSICWHWTAGFDLHWLHRRRNACGYTVPLSNSQYVCSRVYCIAVKLSVCLSTLCLDKIRVSAQVIIFATARTHWLNWSDRYRARGFMWAPVWRHNQPVWGQNEERLFISAQEGSFILLLLFFYSNLYKIGHHLYYRASALCPYKGFHKFVDFIGLSHLFFLRDGI